MCCFCASPALASVWSSIHNGATISSCPRRCLLSFPFTSHLCHLALGPNRAVCSPMVHPWWRSCIASRCCWWCHHDDWHLSLRLCRSTSICTAHLGFRCRPCFPCERSIKTPLGSRCPVHSVFDCCSLQMPTQWTQRRRPTTRWQWSRSLPAVEHDNGNCVPSICLQFQWAMALLPVAWCVQPCSGSAQHLSSWQDRVESACPSFDTTCWSNVNAFIGHTQSKSALPLLASGLISSHSPQHLGTSNNSTSSVSIFHLPVELSHLPTIQVSFGCDGADCAFRDDQDDCAFFWAKELPHAFPLVSVVAFACLFPVTSQFLCCVSSDNITRQQLQQEPLIHPPWCDCFHLRADIVILSTISIPSNLLQSWVVANLLFFWLWHNLIGCWLVVMLLGSSQRSSLIRQLVMPPIFQPVHLVHNLLQAFRPLFRMKFFSFWSRLLSFYVPLSSQHTCTFWNHHDPLACLREGEPKEWCKRSFGSVSFHRNQPSYNCVSHWVTYLANWSNKKLCWKWTKLSCSNNMELDNKSNNNWCGQCPWLCWLPFCKWNLAGQFGIVLSFQLILKLWCLHCHFILHGRPFNLSHIFSFWSTLFCRNAVVSWGMTHISHQNQETLGKILIFHRMHSSQ